MNRQHISAWQDIFREPRAPLREVKSFGEHAGRTQDAIERIGVVAVHRTDEHLGANAEVSCPSIWLDAAPPVVEDLLDLGEDTLRTHGLSITASARSCRCLSSHMSMTDCHVTSRSTVE